MDNDSQLQTRTKRPKASLLAFLAVIVGMLAIIPLLRFVGLNSDVKFLIVVGISGSVIPAALNAGHKIEVFKE